MVCLGNICINTLQKGENDDDNDDDDDDDDDDNNNNNNNNNNKCMLCIFWNIKTKHCKQNFAQIQ
jgi:hypothetical protein